jgi:hypothetical protein
MSELLDFSKQLSLKITYKSKNILERIYMIIDIKILEYVVGFYRFTALVNWYS